VFDFEYSRTQQWGTPGSTARAPVPPPTQWCSSIFFKDEKEERRKKKWKEEPTPPPPSMYFPTSIVFGPYIHQIFTLLYILSSLFTSLDQFVYTYHVVVWWVQFALYSLLLNVDSVTWRGGVQDKWDVQRHVSSLSKATLSLPNPAAIFYTPFDTLLALSFQLNLI
jgi:hypothetical protein